MMNVNLKAKVGGRFKFVVTNAVTGVQRDLGVSEWMPNLITNTGLDRMGQNATYMSHCQLGTGSTTPAVTDTALAAYSVSIATSTSTTGTVNTTPRYHWAQKVWTLNPRGSNFNYSEVGVGWSASSGSLFSRALILDSGGSPTSITVLADEYLTVTYELRLYVPETDQTFNVTDSITLIEHTITARAAEADNSGFWGIDNRIMLIQSVNACSGAIASIDAIPSGAVAGTGVTGTYTTGTYTSTNSATWGLGVANFAEGIKSFYIKPTGAGMTFQFGVSPAIMKTSEDTLAISFSWSWARKTL